MTVRAVAGGFCKRWCETAGGRDQQRRAALAPPCPSSSLQVGGRLRPALERSFAPAPPTSRRAARKRAAAGVQRHDVEVCEVTRRRGAQQQRAATGSPWRRSPRSATCPPTAVSSSCLRSGPGEWEGSWEVPVERLGSFSRLSRPSLSFRGTARRYKAMRRPHGGLPMCRTPESEKEKW